MGLAIAATIAAGIAVYFIRQGLAEFLAGKDARYRSRMMALVVCTAIGVSAGIAVVQRNSCVEADPVLLKDNQFIIYYHEDDSQSADSQTTLVTYGTGTSTLTVEELGFQNDRGDFLGWKVYRADTKQWRIVNALGEQVWNRWLGKDDDYFLYKNGQGVSKTVPAGMAAHFYAQWAP